jgi:hypothetical protein
MPFVLRRRGEERRGEERRRSGKEGVLQVPED